MKIDTYNELVDERDRLKTLLTECIVLLEHIPLTVRQVVESDYLCEYSGINPYCMNEGLADGDEPYTLNLRKFRDACTEKG